MLNFQLFNPVNIVFGKGSIGELPNLLNDKKIFYLFMVLDL